jgi:hypothetical protein
MLRLCQAVKKECLFFLMLILGIVLFTNLKCHGNVQNHLQKQRHYGTGGGQMIDMISREEFERRIKPYDTDDPMDKALYNFAHNKMIDCQSVELGKFIEKVFETLREMDDAVDVICNLDVDAVLDRMEVDG